MTRRRIRIKGRWRGGVKAFVPSPKLESTFISAGEREELFSREWLLRRMARNISNDEKGILAALLEAQANNSNTIILKDHGLTVGSVITIKFTEDSLPDQRYDVLEVDGDKVTLEPI